MMIESVSRNGHARGRICIVAVAVLALFAGATACGSDESDTNKPPTAATADGAPQGNDKEQVRALLDDLQSDYIAGRAEAYCAKLTRGGRELIARFARMYDLGRDCETFVTQTSNMARETGVKQKPTVTLRVKVKDNRAVATVSDGGRPPEPLVFLKQDDGWKLTDPGVGKTLTRNGGRQSQLPAPQAPR